MSWRQMLFLSGFVTFLLLVVLDGRDTIVAATMEESSDEIVKKRVFVQELEASNFLKKKREKRSARFTDEVNAKTRMVLTADEQGREYYEEQRNEFENFTEEQHDEQDERSREQIEQWREYHYEGLYPPYLYDQHVV